MTSHTVTRQIQLNENSTKFADSVLATLKSCGCSADMGAIVSKALVIVDKLASNAGNRSFRAGSSYVKVKRVQ